MAEHQPYGLHERSATEQRTDPRRNLSVRAESIDEGKRSLEAVMSTEGRVKIFDISRFEVVEEILLADSFEFPNQIPLLDSHSRWSVETVLGSVKNIRKDGQQIIGRVDFAADPVSVIAFEKYRDGHLTDFSVGYEPLARSYAEPGETMEVNGKSYTAGVLPLAVTTRTKLKELSAVPIGADPEATARALMDSLRKENRMTFEQWLEKLGVRADTLSDAQRAQYQSMYDAERAAADDGGTPAPAPAAPAPAAPAPTPAPATATRSAVDDIAPVSNVISMEAVGAEVTRQLGEIAATRAGIEEAIRSEAATYGLDDVVVNRCLANPAVSLESARSEFLAELNGRGTDGLNIPMISVGKDDSSSMDQVGAALMVRSGNAELALETYGENATNDSSKFRDISLIEVCRMTAGLEGVSIGGYNNDDAIRAGVSTQSLPKLLGNVANKSAMKAYVDQAPTWMKLAGRKNTADFKLHTGVRYTPNSTLELIGRGQEVPHGTGKEETETYSVLQYGKQFQLDRMDIINDDLNAFTELPAKMARAASLNVSKQFYTNLLANGNSSDGNAFFSTAHANLLSGTDSYMTPENAIIAVNKAVEALETQTDVNGDPIDVSGVFILGTPAMRATLMNLEKSTNTNPGGTTGVKQMLTTNIWQGTFENVIESRLQNSNYTNYSKVAWYMFANPMAAAAQVVCFLNGQETPTVTRYDAGPNYLGIKFSVVHDVGVANWDYRAAVKSTGA